MGRRGAPQLRGPLPRWAGRTRPALRTLRSVFSEEGTHRVPPSHQPSPPAHCPFRLGGTRALLPEGGTLTRSRSRATKNRRPLGRVCGVVAAVGPPSREQYLLPTFARSRSPTLPQPRLSLPTPTPSHSHKVQCACGSTNAPSCKSFVAAAASVTPPRWGQRRGTPSPLKFPRSTFQSLSSSLFYSEGEKKESKVIAQGNVGGGHLSKCF